MRLTERDALLSRVCGQIWPFEALLDAVNVPPRARVLDIGGGEGGLLAELARRGHVGKRELVDLVHGTDTYALPCPDASIDLVFMLQLLAHLEHPALAQAEARRVLAPGGRLVIAAHGSDHLVNLFPVSQPVAVKVDVPDGTFFDILLPVTLEPDDQEHIARSYGRTVVPKLDLETWLHLSGHIFQAPEPI